MTFLMFFIHHTGCTFFMASASKAWNAHMTIDKSQLFAFSALARRAVLSKLPCLSESFLWVWRLFDPGSWYQFFYLSGTEGHPPDIKLN